MLHYFFPTPCGALCAAVQHISVRYEIKEKQTGSSTSRIDSIIEYKLLHKLQSKNIFCNPILNLLHVPTDATFTGSERTISCYHIHWYHHCIRHKWCNHFTNHHVSKKSDRLSEDSYWLFNNFSQPPGKCNRASHSGRASRMYTRVVQFKPRQKPGFSIICESCIKLS
jgi:hypothetical protein